MDPGRVRGRPARIGRRAAGGSAADAGQETGGAGAGAGAAGGSTAGGCGSGGCGNGVDSGAAAGENAYGSSEAGGIAVWRGGGKTGGAGRSGSISGRPISRPRTDPERSRRGVTRRTGSTWGTAAGGGAA